MRSAIARTQADRFQIFIDGAKSRRARYQAVLDNPAGYLPSDLDRARDLISSVDLELKDLERKLADLKEMS